MGIAIWRSEYNAAWQPPGRRRQFGLAWSAGPGLRKPRLCFYWYHQPWHLSPLLRSFTCNGPQQYWASLVKQLKAARGNTPLPPTQDHYFHSSPIPPTITTMSPVSVDSSQVLLSPHHNQCTLASGSPPYYSPTPWRTQFILVSNRNPLGILLNVSAIL